MNVILGWFAYASWGHLEVAIWAAPLGGWAAMLIRAGEILADEDMPLTRNPVTITLNQERTR